MDVNKLEDQKMGLHSNACCKVSLKTVKKDGLMRPKAFYELSLECEQLPGLPLQRYVLMRDCVALPLLRVRLWLAKRELHRMARKVLKFKKRQKV